MRVRVTIREVWRSNIFCVISGIWLVWSEHKNCNLPNIKMELLGLAKLNTPVSKGIQAKYDSSQNWWETKFT